MDSDLVAVDDAMGATKANWHGASLHTEWHICALHMVVQKYLHDCMYLCMGALMPLVGVVSVNAVSNGTHDPLLASPFHNDVSTASMNAKCLGHLIPLCRSF